MGRRIRTDVPQLKDNLIPKWEYVCYFRSLDEKYKQIQKENYDRRHHVKTLPSLPEGQTMWVDTRGHQTPGRISMEAGTPRSYLIETPSGELRQNRAHLRIQNNQEPIGEPVDIPTTTGQSPVITHGLLLAHRQEQPSVLQIVYYMSQALKRDNVTCRYI